MNKVGGERGLLEGHVTHFLAWNGAHRQPRLEGGEESFPRTKLESRERERQSGVRDSLDSRSTSRCDNASACLTMSLLPRSIYSRDRASLAPLLLLHTLFLLLYYAKNHSPLNKMGDYIAKSKARRAERDAAIPKEYLVDLSAAGVPSLPEESLPLPYSKTEPHHPEPTTIYPKDNVTTVPSKVLSLEDVAITETPIDKLLSMLSTGKLTSVRCTEAFLRRAVLAQQLTNCATDFYPT